MAKNSLLDYSTTPDNNTDIGGIGIQGTSAVNNFDNAFRTLMSQMRTDLDYKQVFASKTGNYTAVANDNNATLRFTSNYTLSLTAAATLGANWHITVIAGGGPVTIDPNSTETINGLDTLVIQKGASATIICDGTQFFASVDDNYTYASKSANYTAVLADNGSVVRFTANATLSLTAAATLGSTWRMTVIADNATVVIDPNASETINGAATLTLRKGTTATIICDGSNFFAILAGAFFSPSTTSGYEIRPDGMIEQWGVVNFSAASSVVVTFPFAYPTQQMINNASVRNGASTSRIVSTDAGSQSQMTIFLDTAATLTVAWRSIGY